jgi:hypothetical protein
MNQPIVDSHGRPARDEISNEDEDQGPEDNGEDGHQQDKVETAEPRDHPSNQPVVFHGLTRSFIINRALLSATSSAVYSHSRR